MISPRRRNRRARPRAGGRSARAPARLTAAFLSGPLGSASRSQRRQLEPPWPERASRFAGRGFGGGCGDARRRASAPARRARRRLLLASSHRLANIIADGRARGAAARRGRRDAARAHGRRARRAGARAAAAEGEPPDAAAEAEARMGRRAEDRARSGSGVIVLRRRRHRPRSTRLVGFVILDDRRRLLGRTARNLRGGVARLRSRRLAPEEEAAGVQQRGRRR